MVAYVFIILQPGVVLRSIFSSVPWCRFGGAVPSTRRLKTMPESISRSNEPPPYARAVLSVVRRIPSARVMTYGDVAEYLERGTARQVGAVMAGYGSEVAWWRVVNASGRLPEWLRGQAVAHYLSEGTPFDLEGERVRLSACRWDGSE